LARKNLKRIFIILILLTVNKYLVRSGRISRSCNAKGTRWRKRYWPENKQARH